MEVASHLGRTTGSERLRSSEWHPGRRKRISPGERMDGGQCAHSQGEGSSPRGVCKKAGTASGDRCREGLGCQLQVVEHYPAGDKRPPPHEELQTTGSGVGRRLMTAQQIQPRMTSRGIQHRNQGNGQVTQFVGHPSGHPTGGYLFPRTGTASGQVVPQTGCPWLLQSPQPL